MPMAEPRWPLRPPRNSAAGRPNSHNATSSTISSQHCSRQALGNENLHIGLGRVSPPRLPELFWKHLDTIRTAQTDFAREDENTTLITSSDDFGFSDFWHYDAQAYLDLGREFGDALADLELRDPEKIESP